MATFFWIIVSRHLQNDLHAFKINSSDILFHAFLAPSAGAAEYTDCISANKCPGYDIKQSDGEAPVLQEFWVIPSTPLLPLLPDNLWPGVVAPDKVQSIG